MTYTTEGSRTMAVNEQEWAALTDVENRMYDGVHGVFAYTEVNERDGGAHGMIPVLFEHARMNAEGTDDYDDQELVEESAGRVAAALAILAFGVEFGVELTAKATV